MTETTTHVAGGDARSLQTSPQSYTAADGQRGPTMTRTPVEMSTASGPRSREALARADRIQIALLSGVFALLAAILGAGALAYTTLSGQILAVQQNVHDEISALGTGMSVELHGEVGGLRAEMREEIGGLRAEMQEEIGGFRTEMREEIGGFRTEIREEIGGLRTEVREEIGGLRTEMRHLSERLARIETLIEIHHGPPSGL